MNNVIVIRLSAAGVEAFALDPHEAHTIVVINDNAPRLFQIVKEDGTVWGNEYGPYEYTSMLSGSYKARNCGLRNFSTRVKPVERIELENTQALDRLPAADVEKIWKILKG